MHLALAAGVLLIMSVSGAAFGAERILLPSPTRADGTVELFVQMPTAAGPRPAILMVHGHQFGGRPGGAAYVRSGVLERMASRGYVAAAVSQPGYGTSDGPPDYCGPRTQAAIRAALRHLESLANVDGERVALYGFSRGAIASAMVAVEEPALAAVVLVAGTFDLGRAFPTGQPGLDENILREAGRGEAVDSARSALRHADRIVTPVLFVHGARDDRAPVDQVRAFAAILRGNGVPVRVAIYEDEGHSVSREKVGQALLPFLAEMFGDDPVEAEIDR